MQKVRIVESAKDESAMVRAVESAKGDSTKVRGVESGVPKVRTQR